jgi:hypothetical protein
MNLKKRFRVYGFSLVMIFLLNLLASCALQERLYDAPKEPATPDPNTVNLVIDTLNYKDMPRNFRKTTDLTVLQKDKTIDVKGLDKLNISGSQQFSGFNLPLVISGINTKLPTTVIDLRQESHGFINDIPVSWKNLKNDANIGMTREQVLANEKSKLQSIKLNVPITFFNHPNMPVTPTKVQDEEQLTKDKNLNYIRITVTDGKIPTNDMVDYFIQVVKDQPNNTWLHFHCKEGIGRTSTFMIMYDMMKNSKQVSFDNIAKRQLTLAGFDENQIRLFYNKERTAFLQNFYKYCNENKDNFNVKWSEWIKTITTSNSPFSNYVKNTLKPKQLYVISQDRLSEAEKTMLATLQGVVNSQSAYQIYILSSSQPDYSLWLNDLKSSYGVNFKNVYDPWELVHMFKDYVEGYVLYSGSDNPSINNACSLCGLKNSIAVDKSIEYKVKLHGITKLKGDCRNTNEAWAYENLWNKGLNHSLVIQLQPSKASALRDYALMSKALVFYENDPNTTKLREKIFSSMDKNSVCLGWGPDEFVNVSTASKDGVSVVAADWSYNLTVLSSFDSKPLMQKAEDKEIPKEDNVHYVTFIMSDGDNQQWNLGSNYNSQKWFGSTNRGKFHMGWGISPSMYYLAPTVFKKYYDSVSNKPFEDYFIVPPSGNGYMYPSKFEKSRLKLYLQQLDDYMKDTDEKYMAVIDDCSFHDKRLWNKFTDKPHMKGIFYLDYHRHDNYHGEIIWSKNKPIVSCRDLLWSGLEDESQLVKNINDRVENGETNVNDPKAYTFVYVHAWSKTMDNVKSAMDMLNKNPKVRVVSPKVFMETIDRNVKR